jgi:hypothetical protein
MATARTDTIMGRHEAADTCRHRPGQARFEIGTTGRH